MVAQEPSKIQVINIIVKYDHVIIATGDHIHIYPSLYRCLSVENSNLKLRACSGQIFIKGLLYSRENKKRCKKKSKTLFVLGRMGYACLN
jgi:hypothetical protein